jgi:hypothetical protein
MQHEKFVAMSFLHGKLFSKIIKFLIDTDVRTFFLAVKHYYTYVKYIYQQKSNIK